MVSRSAHALSPLYDELLDLRSQIQAILMVNFGKPRKRTFLLSL